MHLPGSPELGLFFLIGCAVKVTFVLTLRAPSAAGPRQRAIMCGRSESRVRWPSRF